MAFEALGLKEWLVKQIKAVGYKTPTPVQINCIPPILQGKDCIGCAKTGSGKTAAFALPILQKLGEDPHGEFALVLTPTRELAYQIADQFRVFSRPMSYKDCIIVGGVDMMKQSLELAKQPHVIIATPGRLAAHLQTAQSVSLNRIKFLEAFVIKVLDEADRLLDASFAEDLSVIFDSIAKKRQTLFFSATLTDSLNRLQELAVTKPFCWQAPLDTVTVELLDQRYVLVPAKVKDCYLVSILQVLHDKEGKTLILFTNSCRNCHILTILLRTLGFSCTCLHSLLSQGERLASLAKFRGNKTRMLVCTDVASRGLDIPTVSAVINTNVPASPKDYIHRVGRTARAGRGGIAITLVTQYDIECLHNIESHIKMRLGEYPVSENKALKHINLITITRREVELKLRQSNFGENRRIHMAKRKILEKMKSKRELKRLKKQH